MTMIETIAADAKAPAPETQDIDPRNDGVVATETHVYADGRLAPFPVHVVTADTEMP